jgi:diguanylate cyclase (GGDEF)-like protein/PAS domain S-box-containing protein
MTSLNPGGGRVAEAAIGAALALLGAAVAAGWWLRNPALIQLLPGLRPMVLNSALCFVLAGGWLMVNAARVRLPRLARVLAAALLVIAAAETLQYPLGADFGIDAAKLHRWLWAGAPRPGRMSLFTGIAFVLAGLAMLLATAASRPRRDTLAVLFASGAGVAGVLTLLGYLFELHLIYPSYAFELVALETAMGLIALSIALWLNLIRSQRVRFWNRLPVHERITFASAAILALVSLAVGVSVFAALQARVEQALSDELAMSLRFRVSLAQEVIEGGLQRSRILIGRPAPARALRRVRERANDAEAIALLSQSAASLVADGYRAAVYFDREGGELARAGRPGGAAPLRVPLRGAPGATLAWQGGFVLSGHYTLSDADGLLGSALVEVPLPALDTLLKDSYRLGRTGEAGMCARFGDRLGCFPQPRNPRVYFTPATSADGELLPMARGLAGETAVSLLHDYRGQHVMAAYGPVADSGLAMVVKSDTAEIYAPIRERLQLLVPILALLILGGTWLLRAGVRPLAARLERSERVAQERHRALDSMMASVADGIMVLDADGTIRSWNAAAARLFGYSAQEVVGRSISMLVPEELRESQRAATQRFLATGVSNVIGRVDLNYAARRKDGSLFELEFTVSEMGGGAAPQLVAVFRDITTRKEAEQRLTQLALHDSLTGLPNRPYFEERFAEVLARCRRSGEPLALMILDLDNFKPVNDTLGHEVGDQLLIAFGRQLKTALRESDLLARIGGDEFTIVVEGVKSRDDAAAIADKLFAVLRDPLDVAGHLIVISASIGIALCRASDSPQALMKRADRALYEAKRAGRARYHIDT